MKKLFLLLFCAGVFFAARGAKSIWQKGHLGLDTSPTRQDASAGKTIPDQVRPGLGLCVVCVVGDLALLSDNRIVKRGDVIDGKKIVAVDERGVHLFAGSRRVLFAVKG